MPSVALRKESVDRNLVAITSIFARQESLSARRAWIEIHVPFYPKSSDTVALRKESVDRNKDTLIQVLFDKIVALRKESVDRNMK